MIHIHRGFARGAISRYLDARPDTVDHAFGSRKIMNLIVTKEGILEKRAGLNYVDESRFPTKECRLIPFIFSTSTGDTYIIQAGDQYLEFIRAGARVTESVKNITGATQASPCVLTSVAHGYSNGDDLIVSGFTGGMLELNGRRVRVANKTDDTFEITDTSGTPIDSSAFSAYDAGGQVNRVYKIASPWLEAELQDLRFAQSADVMTIVHPSYAPRELSRTGHTSWTLATPSFAVPTLPTNSSAAGTGGALSFRYRVTMEANDGSGRESAPALGATVALITGISKANPAVVSATAHGLENGEEVYFSGVLGMTQMNGRRAVVANKTADTFELEGVDSTGFTTYAGSSTDSLRRTYAIAKAVATPTEAAPITITITMGSSTSGWTASLPCRFNIYKERGGVYGYIGSRDHPGFSALPSGTTFQDKGLVTPDVLDTPPRDESLFDAAGDYPSVVAYHQQRLLLGAPDDEPEALWASKIGGYKAFEGRDFPSDTDKWKAVLASLEVNRIMHVVPLRRAVVLTGAQEWVLEGDQAGTLTPSLINPRPYSNQGASRVRPAVVDSDILYVQARGNQVRSLYWDFQNDTYGGEDLTRKASHLFRGMSIRDMAFSAIPDGILWAVRSDGRLLSLTYSRQEQIVGWCEHKTAGHVEQVAQIPESDADTTGGENAVYVLVVRTAGGRTVRNVERLRSRVSSDTLRERYSWLGPTEDQPFGWRHEYAFLDSFLTYNGWNLGSGTLTLTGSGWTSAHLLTLTSSAPLFKSTDEGTGEAARKFFLCDADGNRVVLQVVEYTSSTVVTVRSDRPVPTSLRAVARTTWAAAVRRVTGLSHLEGSRISAVGDGARIANAYRDASPLEVEDGAVTFSAGKFSAVIHVGLPVHADLVTLDLENPEGESVAGKMKNVMNAGAYVKDAGSLWAGHELPDEDSTNLVDGLVEMDGAEPEGQSGDTPPPLFTGHVDMQLGGNPTEHGRVGFRDVEPTPLSILAVTRVLGRVA